MPLTRLYEEEELPSDLRRIFAEIRSAFDLPFVPSLFKACAGNPAYLRLMWRDLKRVAISQEFQSAASALEEYTRALSLQSDFRFAGQERILAGQHFSPNDVEHMAAIARIFARALPAVALFVRLMQRGYCGGQPGHVTPRRQISALARMAVLQIPNERQASLRVWLIYHDIKRATGSSNVMSLLRLLSPFPGYLASVWLDCKRALEDPSLQHAREELGVRTLALTSGLPVRDHRAEGKQITPAQWKEIEQTVDGVVHQVSLWSLLVPLWQYAFRSNIRRAAA